VDYSLLVQLSVLIVIGGLAGMLGGHLMARKRNTAVLPTEPSTTKKSQSKEILSAVARVTQDMTELRKRCEEIARSFELSKSRHTKAFEAVHITLSGLEQSVKDNEGDLRRFRSDVNEFKDTMAAQLRGLSGLAGGAVDVGVRLAPDRRSQTPGKSETLVAKPSTVPSPQPVQSPEPLASLDVLILALCNRLDLESGRELEKFRSFWNREAPGRVRTIEVRNRAYVFEGMEQLLYVHPWTNSPLQAAWQEGFSIRGQSNFRVHRVVSVAVYGRKADGIPFLIARGEVETEE